MRLKDVYESHRYSIERDYKIPSKYFGTCGIISKNRDIYSVFYPDKIERFTKIEEAVCLKKPVKFNWHEDVRRWIEEGREEEEKAKIKPKAKKTASDPIEEVRKYAKLRDEGLITEEEYQAKKKELLGLPASPKSDAADLATDFGDAGNPNNSFFLAWYSSSVIKPSSRSLAYLRTSSIGSDAVFLALGLILAFSSSSLPSSIQRLTSSCQLNLTGFLRQTASSILVKRSILSG
jgi:hypothetical protein